MSKQKSPAFTAEDALRITETVHMVADRIRTGWSNVGKKAMIADHFEQVRVIKNLMAKFAFSRLPIIELPNFRKYGYQIFRAGLPESLENVLTDWELQQLFNKVACEHTINHVQQVITNRTFHLTRGSPKLEKGHIRWKGHIVYGDLATLLNALRFRGIPATDTDIPKKWQKTWFNYCGKFGRDRLIRLLADHQSNVERRIHPVEYTTGSYMKAAQFNKHKEKPTWHSHWFRKPDCRLFKDWYLFKTPHWAKALPLAVNQGYHNKPYDLTKEHWVTLNRRGEVDISLAYDRTDVLMAPKAAVGIDLNVKSNLLAASTGLMFRLEEDWLQKHEADLSRLEKKGYQNLVTEDRLRLKRIVKHRESTLRNKIQELLLQLRAQGVTDVILESLSITLGGGLSRRMHKLLRLLRFGTIRTWMREQAHKLGMRIHDFPPAYSSQACRCGHVDPGNRKDQKFECPLCGSSEHADTHAGNSLLWLFEQARDVLVRDGFLIVNAFGEYEATTKARFEYKSIKAYYERKTGVSNIQGGMLVMDQLLSTVRGNPCPSGQGT
jgi:hypothetical protein